MAVARHANGDGNGTTVQVHNAERDGPGLIRDSMCAIMQPLVADSHHPAQQAAIAS